MDDTVTPMTLHVWDYVRILSNVSLGTARLFPAGLVPGEMKEMVLPVSDGGELRVLAQITPIEGVIRNVTNMKLPRLRIVLERLEYQAGDTVRGAVIANFAEPTKVVGIRMRASCETIVSWTEGSGNDSTTYAGHQRYYNHRATMFGHPKGTKEFVMADGSHYYPFEFIIPPWCPPSYNGALYATTTHMIKAYVAVPRGLDWIAMEQLQVAANYSFTPKPGSLLQARQVKQAAAKSSLWANNQNIAITVTGAPAAYLGDTYEAEVVVENRSLKAVTEVSVLLGTQAVFCDMVVSRYRTSFGMLPTTEVKDLDGAKIKVAPRATKSFKTIIQIPLLTAKRGDPGNMTLPAGIGPTIPGQLSPMLQIYHLLCIGASTEGSVFTKTTSAAAVPLFLGQRPDSNRPAPSLCVAPPTTYSLPIRFAQTPSDYIKYLSPTPRTEERNRNWYIGPTLSPEAFAALPNLDFHLAEEAPFISRHFLKFDPKDAYTATGVTNMAPPASDSIITAIDTSTPTPTPETPGAASSENVITSQGGDSKYAVQIESTAHLLHAFEDDGSCSGPPPDIAGYAASAAGVSNSPVPFASTVIPTPNNADQSTAKLLNGDPRPIAAGDFDLL